MEHTPENCPLKIVVEQLGKDIIRINDDVKENKEDIKTTKDMFHKVDKAVSNTNVQYETIITMLTSQGKDYKELQINTEKEFIRLREDMSKMRTDFAVNDYKTNQSVSFMEKVTWGALGKIGALIGVVGVTIAFIVETLK